MVRVTVAAPREVLNETIETLHKAKLLHLDPHDPKDGVGIGDPLPNADHISKLLVSLAGLRALVPSNKPPVDMKLTIKKAEEIEQRVRSRAQKFHIRIQEAEHDIRAAEEVLEQLSFLDQLGIKETKMLTGYEYLSSAIGTVSNPDALEQLPASTIQFSSPRKRKAEGGIAIFYSHEQEEQVRDILAVAGFTPVTVPVQFTEIIIKKEIALVTKRKQMATAECNEARAGLQKIADEEGPILAAVENFITAEVRKGEAPLQFAVSDFTFVISGWLPKKNKEDLETKLHAINKHIYIQTEEATQTAPIKFRNNPVTRPFEFFLRLYTLPRYGEFEPTLLTFLTFPMFFGMMLGDIGYGITVFLAFGLLRWKLPQYGGLFLIFMISSAWTIAFGYFFGEFFGAEEVFGYHLYPFIHRVTEVSQMLVATLVIGVAHIGLAYTIGFVNKLKSHGIRHAIFGKGSWLLLEAGGVLWFLDVFNVYAFNQLYSLGIVGIAIIMLLVGEGPLGLIEVPGLASNILSYTRLAAVGLASASLAVLANTMAGQLFAQGGFMIVAGVLVLLAIHTLNILIGLLDSFLQSLRLHYVETFTKFYQGNGEAYKPFGS